jgi:catechol 2,3-dioxygenase-like lactoylglutathione lyase family enzyme
MHEHSKESQDRSAPAAERAHAPTRSRTRTDPPTHAPRLMALGACLALALAAFVAAPAAGQEAGGKSADEGGPGAGEQPGPSGTGAAGQEPQDSPAGRQPAGRIEGLTGLDHVVIAVNDLAGAVEAYRRLGFEVVPADGAITGGPGAFVDLGTAYLGLMAPPDSAGEPRPYTFEGGLAQGWEVRDLGPAIVGLEKAGAAFREGEPAELAEEGGGASERAQAPGRGPWRLALPQVQPISGTSVYLVQVDQPALDRLLKPDGPGPGSAAAPEHPNGARGLAYVTVAVRSFEQPVKILRSWGLDPKPPVEDTRGARSVEVDLPEGKLFLVAPLTGGGINDFLEERRARAAPVGDRYYEGSILAIGIAVEDLDQTIDYLKERGIAHVPMELPTVGRAEVVQGAPGWGLRLEFVEDAAASSGGRTAAAE